MNELFPLLHDGTNIIFRDRQPKGNSPMKMRGVLIRNVEKTLKVTRILFYGHGINLFSLLREVPILNLKKH